MKILIWIKKEEAISGAITEHHYTIPQAGYQNYVQVEVSQDEFTQLEDKKHDRWLVDQYNRNRLAEDQIENANQIETGRSHDNYIYERNPDTNEVFERKSGDYKNRRKINQLYEYRKTKTRISKNEKSRA